MKQAADRLKLTRSDFMGLLIHPYAIAVTDRDVEDVRNDGGPGSPLGITRQSDGRQSSRLVMVGLRRQLQPLAPA